MNGRPPLRRSRRTAIAIIAGVSAAVASAIFAVANASDPPHLPFGRFDSLRQTTDGFSVQGWAIDPDTSSPIKVDVYLDGKGIKRLLADRSRPDVAAKYPAYGDKHGFTAAFPAKAGEHRVCVFAINAGAGATNPRLSCREITINFDPVGKIVTAKQFPGGVTAAGWAVDSNKPTTALSVAISVDGTRTPAVVANRSRSDVGMQPAAGPLHGFSIKVKASEGSHRLCLAITNVGLGSDSVVSCRTVTLNFSPTGAISSLIQIPGGFRVAGNASDPDTSNPVTVSVTADGVGVGTATANRTSYDGHGFAASLKLGGTALPPGTRKVCVTANNLGTYGTTRQIACRSIALNFNPKAIAISLVQRSPGARIGGWAIDPDTDSPVPVKIVADGATVATVTANRTGTVKPGHQFAALVSLPNGVHKVCAVAVNLSYGSGNSPSSCRSVTLNFNPYGRFDTAVRVKGSTKITLTGWALDPDTNGPLTIRASMDGTSLTPTTTKILRPDVTAKYPGTNPNAGFSVTYPATDGEHRLCVTAVNVAGGSGNTSFGCRIVNAVHPVPPSIPRNVAATGGYGGATVKWTAPASDGGAPWTGYVVTSSPGGIVTKVGAKATSATIFGLKSSTTYTFSVVAVNVAGKSAAGVSPTIKTAASPPAQTTPAPISTSRYIRNIKAATSTDLATMRAEGAADAKANPSGHGYLILLDIGGQDQYDGGVLLSATTHFVSYSDLVKNIKAYVDGYHSAQKPSAPVIIALGTNNDVDVSSAAGVTWANSVVDPVKSYASKYLSMTIAGANDIEPGFRGTYAQTKAWLSGYLQNTSAPFVNNGSADGCAWTVASAGCNNGWTMAGLYYLSAGAAPVRIINLPQIYNNTMAQQWKYISLTGIAQSKPRINFGGALTEWTACAQTGSCGSLTGTAAWTQMWNQLQSHPQLKVGSLPYSTDLRIDR